MVTAIHSTSDVESGKLLSPVVKPSIKTYLIGFILITFICSIMLFMFQETVEETLKIDPVFANVLSTDCYIIMPLKITYDTIKTKLLILMAGYQKNSEVSVALRERAAYTADYAGNFINRFIEDYYKRKNFYNVEPLYVYATLFTMNIFIFYINHIHFKIMFKYHRLTTFFISILWFSSLYFIVTLIRFISSGTTCNYTLS